MKLSIILTVYNKEPYLRRAIESMVSQKGPFTDEYEILAVNDGSTDGSLLILNEYMQNNRRIRVLTQSNQGLSVARNNGLFSAKGEYVWFVDADDIISEDAVSIICKAIEQSPDVIPIYASTEGVNRTRNCITPSVKTGHEILIERKWEECGVFYILKRSFLVDNSLQFVPGLFHEDADFTPRMLYVAKSAVVIPKVLYTVVRTPGSITNVPNPKRAYDLLSVATRHYELIKNDHLWRTAVGHSISYHGAASITNALHVIIQQDKEEQNRFNNLYSANKYLTKMFLHSSTTRYILLGALLTVSPKNSVGIYRLLKSLTK